MTLSTRKKLFLLLYLFFIISPFVTVFVNTPPSKALSNELVLINVVQRIAGLLAFVLVSTQIVLGNFMEKWVQIIGSKAYRIHIVQGLITYGLVLFHPLMEILIVYKISESFLGAIGVILPRFDSQREIYLVYGKTALLLMTFAVIAAFFRTKPFFRKNWRKLHILNYFVFFSVYLHMRVGSDIVTPPFVWVSWLALALVIGGLIYKYVYPLISIIKNRTVADTKGQKA